MAPGDSDSTPSIVQRIQSFSVWTHHLCSPDTNSPRRS